MRIATGCILGNPHKNTRSFFSRNFAGESHSIFKVLKGKKKKKNFQLRILYSA